MTTKIGYAEGTCPRCGRTLRRRRPADLAICSCWEYCPTDHGLGIYGTLMEDYYVKLEGEKKLFSFEGTAEFLDPCYGTVWINAQSFIVPIDSLLTSVYLLVAKIGSPNDDIYVTIRNIDSAGKPVAGDLASGKILKEVLTTSAQWQLASFSSSLKVKQNEKYAIVTKSPLSSFPNVPTVGGRYQSYPDYEDGIYLLSTNGEISWISVPTEDLRFKFYGFPVGIDLTPSTYGPIQVESGKAWGDLKKPMKILRRCPICEYHSAQLPVEVRLT